MLDESAKPLPDSVASDAPNLAPFSGRVKAKVGQLSNRYNSGMPNFRIGRNVFENVHNLRKALGSATRELSQQDLAALISAEHPAKRSLNSTTVGRWEDGVEPDLHSLRIMARLAGVGLDQFAFGGGTTHPETEKAPVSERPQWPNVKLPDPLASLDAPKKRRHGNGGR